MYVREGEDERFVGQYATGTPEEALAYYARKFDELEGHVRLLEARVARKTVGLNVVDTVKNLQTQLIAPAAVGDLKTLRERTVKLLERAESFVQAQREELEKERQRAIAERAKLVEQAEQLVAKLSERTQWRAAGDKLEKIFEKWQEAQKNGPQIPRSTADQLWKRFRAARNAFDGARRKFFFELDQTNKEVRARKEKLITQAEALISQGANGLQKYWDLLEEWKAAGRGSRKVEDALWTRFKAVGDLLYAARAEEQAKIDEEQKANLKKKEEMLVEIEELLKETDHKVAREKLGKYQAAWYEIGFIPKNAISSIDSRMRAVERHVKKLEEDHWRKTDPETKARTSGLRSQLEDSIEELEQIIASADASQKEKDAAKEKLEAQKSWLAALEFSS